MPSTVATQQPNAKPRMTLASVTRGKRPSPIRAIVFGLEGVGKSTFAANAPSPIFLGTEDGTGQLDVARFPAPSTFDDILDALRTLTNDKHDYKTLVVDTLDWCEPIIWHHCCVRDDQQNIEAYGYGKGYSAALDEWRVFVVALERLRRDKEMHVLLIAHSWIKTFKNPLGDDFDRYEMKLHNKAAGLLKEWSDAVLFVNYEELAHKDSKTKRVRGVSTGARLIHTERTATYDAKNRYGLPGALPLSWEDFEAAVKAGTPSSMEDLLAELDRKQALLSDDNKLKLTGLILRAAGDVKRLAQANDWANGKLPQSEEQ